MVLPSDENDPASLRREAVDVIDKLRLRELNAGEAGRWLRRIAGRMDGLPELQETAERLRPVGAQLVAAADELQQIRESLVPRHAQELE